MEHFFQPKLFTPSKLRFVCFSSDGPERDLAKLNNVTLQPLINLGMLMISQYNYLNDPMRLERKILWKRPGSEAESMLEIFDAFYLKAGLPVPVLEGALFVVDDPFTIDQIFCEMQKLKYSEKRMTHYMSGAKLELSQGQLLDARYMSFKIFLDDEDDDEDNDEDDVPRSSPKSPKRLKKSE